MKKWKQKALVQKIISFLPLSHRINYFFQKYVTRGVRLSDDYFYDRLGHATEHLKGFRQYSHDAVPKCSLELGTGWYPVVPVSFFLAGVDNIYSVDISFLTSKERLKTTLQKFAVCYHSGELGKYIRVVPERFDTMINILDSINRFSLHEVLKKLNISYLIEDARKLSLPDNSVDLVNSNNTFEHISHDALIAILKELKRVAKKQGGVMSHFIDMSDHFAHLDKTITIYNFLQFSDRQWKWINNSITSQNRNRIYDYRQIYFDLMIPISNETFRKGNPDELKSISLSEKFSNKQLEEIAISHCRFISHMTSLTD
jgi:ubiquinone/menaquinone biosynthesis C-methylase UbiE